MAATAMAPAPMNRTCVRQMVRVCDASSDAATAGPIAVSHGTATAHAITSPSSIAMPTERPTKCPAPSSASDHATLYPLDAVAPSRKKPATPAGGAAPRGANAGGPARRARTGDDGDESLARLARFVFGLAARSRADLQHF